MEQFFYWLGNIANGLSLLTLFVSVLTYVKVQREAKKLARSLQQLPPLNTLPELIEFHKGVDSSRPVALVFSLIPSLGSIRPSVQDFLQAHNCTMPIEEVEMPGLGPNNIAKFYEQVRHKKQILQAKGYTEVHLFIGGPVQAATIIGGLLSNWMPVKLYHRPPGSHTYEYWAPIMRN